MQFDVVVIGAGIVGSSCAYFLAREGPRVCVVDRGGIAGGTSGSGEGNILVSDKGPGPELELATLGCLLWEDLAAQFADDFEYENKGGIIVAENAADMSGLRAAMEAVRGSGVAVSEMDLGDLREAEPYLARDVAGGAFFPQDAQVQPMRASAALMRQALALGAVFLDHTEVVAIDRDARGAVSGVRTRGGLIATPRVVNAAGPWSAQIASMVNARVPVQPRKGHIVVTEPLPPLVRHKVYDAGYGDTVNSGDSALQIASVVEGTKSGTILLGSSRQLKGFDPAVEPAVVQAIVRRAVRFFPILASTRALRAYVGFRPFMPDHLPAIGEVPDVPGFYVNTGHEGAGIGLGPISSKLLGEIILGQSPTMDLTPFDPARFAGSAIACA